MGDEHKTMTWGEFKRAVDAKVGDGVEVFFIDVHLPSPARVEARVTLDGLVVDTGH